MAAKGKPGGDDVNAQVTEYSAWFHVFVEASKLNTANTLARNWDPDPAATTTFTIKLSPTGQEPATHYAVSTPATATMRAGITNALGSIAWSSMYTTTNVLEPIPHWTGPDGWTFDGGVYDAFMSAAASQGLQIIRSIEE
jgi:hypothetical protein